MEANKEDYYSLGEIVHKLKSFLIYLRGKWWLLLLAAFGGAALGAVYYYNQKPKFEAACTFILEEKQSGLGGLSGLASQFGFDIGGASGGSLFAGDNILEILKSSTIIQNVLLSEVDSSNKKLIDLFIESKGWKEKWKNNKRLKAVNFDNIVSISQPLSLQQDTVLGLAHRALVKKNILIERVIKKGSLIQVSVISNNEVFAKLMSERIISYAKAMYVQIKTSNASTNVNRLEWKADSLLRLLNAKSYQAASSVVVDANPALRIAAVPAELNVRDKMVLQTLYAEIIKNLEISRISLMQQTPVIQILDAPTYPLIDKRKGLLFLTTLFFIIGLLISSFFYLIKFYVKNSLSRGV